MLVVQILLCCVVLQLVGVTLILSSVEHRRK